MFRLGKAPLSFLAMFLAMGMFAGCSSTEESSSTGGGSCAEKCAAAPDMNQDECIIACEAEI